MKDTSGFVKARASIQAALDVTRERYAGASGDEANVLGGKVLGLEDALRIIVFELEGK